MTDTNPQGTGAEGSGQPVEKQAAGKQTPGAEHWTRLLYMVGYGFVAYFVLIALFFVAVVQAIIALTSSKPSNDVLALSRNLIAYLGELMAFVTWSSDEKPFPVGPFPGSDRVDGTQPGTGASA